MPPESELLGQSIRAIKVIDFALIFLLIFPFDKNKHVIAALERPTSRISTQENCLAIKGLSLERARNV